MRANRERCSISLAVLMAFSVIAACGGGSVAMENLCQEAQDALCSYLQRCDLAWTLQMSTHMTCDALMDCDEVGLEEMQASVDAGRMEYDSKAAGRCLSLLRNADCAKGVGLFVEVPEECDMIFIGLVAAGQDCYENSECMEGHYCDESEVNCPGQCQAFQRVGDSCGAGEVCDPDVAGCNWQTSQCEALGDAGDNCDNVTCKDGLDCDYDSHPPVCVEPAGEGDPCQTTQDCSGLLRCLESVCAGPSERGQECTVQGYEELGYACEGGSYCDLDLTMGETTGTCQSKKGSGSECLTLFECKSGLLCMGMQVEPLVKGKCGQPLQAGAECDPQMHMWECDYDLFCDEVSATCTAFPRVGDACVYGEDPECLGSDLYCDSLQYGVEGTCRAQKGKGQSCQDDEECESWTCIGGTCLPDDSCSQP